MRVALAVSLALAARAASAAPCPGDAAPRDASTLLVVRRAGQPARSLTAADFAALPQSALTQRLSVSAAGSAPDGARSVTYAGVLLRDVLGAPADRSARWDVVVAVATDGYRAVYSAMELHDGPTGDQAIVVTAQDGKPLDAVEGPVALRTLSDRRPGPRHVRNLCAFAVQPAP